MSFIVRSVFFALMLVSVRGLADEEPRLSIGLNPFRLSTSKSTFKAADGATSSVSLTSIDTLGFSGADDSNPWVEVGFRHRRFVGYLFPFLPDSRREIWAGIKLEDYIEAGAVVAVRRQGFSEPQDLGGEVKISKMSRSEFGLFYRQKFLLMNQTFEGKLRAAAVVGDSTFEDSTLNRQVQGISLQSELLWVWELGRRTEIDTGISFDYEKMNRRQGAFSAGSSSGYEISLNLLRTVFQF
ncbi:MAG: hypothetical protein ACO3A4_00790 [Silvanigrellaceae bacterium]